MSRAAAWVNKTQTCTLVRDYCLNKTYRELAKLNVLSSVPNGGLHRSDWTKNRRLPVWANAGRGGIFATATLT